MKNLLRSTLYLSVFAIAGILFQISCSNSDKPDLAAAINATQIGKIIYVKKITSNNVQLWIANIDGTNQMQIPVAFPANVSLTYNSNSTNPKISPDGQKIIFLALNTTGSVVNYVAIYSCNIDGSNLQELVQQTNNEAIEFSDVY